jgi:hypothetical protein
MLLLIPARAGAQVAGEARPTEVSLTSRPGGPPSPGGRFALTFSLGPGFSHTGFSGGSVDVGLSGVVSVASLRASLWLGSSIGLQLGAAGAMAVAPSTTSSVPSQRFDLEGISGFGLLGGGVLIGARSEGVRASLLGGVAWTWAPLVGSTGTRAGAAPGGGAFIELSHHWRVGDSTLGIGATGWGLFGSDTVAWLGNGSTSWSTLGGGLVAVVSTR